MTFHERKKQRTLHYQQRVYGWKLRPCVACNGTGKYDHNKSPNCSACGGTGKQRYKP
jgi:DnaJ-class molecular chaperone